MKAHTLVDTLRASIREITAVGTLVLALSSQHLNAQVGGDNPRGVAGAFNGQITTGCSYDAYTGNATRSCTDLAVTSVGEYPLTLVRIANSRRAQTSNAANPFGVPGHWNHSYNWILRDSEKRTTQPFQPSSYTVEFPDGGVETFNSVNWDPGYYRVRAMGGDQTTSAGVRERLVPMNPPQNNMIVKLRLPDGGMIEFLATLRQIGSSYYYSYVAQAIYDPYGLATTLAHDGSGRLTRVTEPAGRYLQFSYRTTAGQTHMLDKVTEWINGAARRIVQYNYTNISPDGQFYLALSSVGYYSEWTATYTYSAPNIPPTTGVPLLKTCDDPMYSGPMHKIAYVYRTTTNPDGSTPAYGQIQSENYGTAGPAVSTLAVTGTNTRKETRPDGKWRTFTYGTGADSGFLMSWTDFMNHTARQGYDEKKYINSVTDRNNHTTTYTRNAKTGNVTQIMYPLTAGDTEPEQTQRSTVNYSYEADYYLQESRDEANNPTTYIRDPTTHRITRINYPDDGWESFGYDANHKYQLQTHRMVTGGTESWTYDGRHRKQTYRNPDTAATVSPTAQYNYYDTDYDRVSYITDVLGQTTDFTYNKRGQVLTTTMPVDPFTNERRKITNVYNTDCNINCDGTLASKKDHFNHADHTTTYIYDDYRRLKSITTPDRGDGTGTHTTSYYYDANGTGDDYRYTDSNVTWVTLPSGKRTHTVFDDNRRKKSVTVGSGAEAAITSYDYDDVGNLRVVKLPLQQAGQQWAGRSTVTEYDERNRPYQIRDADNHPTTFKYDWYGRKKRITRPNGQDITYGNYDAMNRPRQQTAENAGTTNYTYKPSGPADLLQTMQDPHLGVYTYTYDGMGRKILVQYPPATDGTPTGEAYWYDPCPQEQGGPNLGTGTLWRYQNRNGKKQTFAHDNLNRMISFSWDDTDPHTPSTLFSYDGASRLTEVNTDNYNIRVQREYFDDNLLKSETENTTPLGGTSKTVNYSYSADGQRVSITYPSNAYSFTYGYNSRNQWNGIGLVASYSYDLNGNMLSRDLLPRGGSSYTYDALDRVEHIAHSFYDGPDDPLRPTPTPRPPPAWKPATLDYDYDSVGNRKWTKRGPPDGGICYGDVFRYDLNDQVTGVYLDIEFGEACEPPAAAPTISYDGAGNRIAFAPYGWQELYAVNALNQYTTRTTTDSPMTSPTPTPRPRPTPHPRPTPPGQRAADYDYTGNMTTGFDDSTYEFDAQNRLLRATKDGVTMEFKYDGLNRQVSRAVGGVTTFSVWDGWDLIEEYRSGNNVTARYLYGPSGLIKNLTSGNYYFQDGSGSTSHLTDNQVQVIEWYLYDLQGVPSFFDADGNELSASDFGGRHLFTGQQWYSDIGLYDLRNRFYSPDIGRFLQPDPIGFNGDAANLYRYCGNNPLTRRDSTGLLDEYPLRLEPPNFWDEDYANYWTEIWMRDLIINGAQGLINGAQDFFAPVEGPLPWLPRGWDTPADSGQPIPTAPPPPATAPGADWPGWKGDVNINPDLQMGIVVDVPVSDGGAPRGWTQLGRTGPDETNYAPFNQGAPNFIPPFGSMGAGTWSGGSIFNANTPGGRYFGAPGGINWSPGSPGGFIPSNMGMIMGMHSPGFQRALRRGMVRPGWQYGVPRSGGDGGSYDRGRHQSRPPRER